MSCAARPPCLAASCQDLEAKTRTTALSQNPFRPGTDGFDISRRGQLYLTLPKTAQCLGNVLA